MSTPRYTFREIMEAYKLGVQSTQIVELLLSKTDKEDADYRQACQDIIRYLNKSLEVNGVNHTLKHLEIKNG